MRRAAASARGGGTLSIGDINGDHRAELAVGVPHETLGRATRWCRTLPVRAVCPSRMKSCTAARPATGPSTPCPGIE
ncbi:FG-GAP repeat protein [Streptomyces sp. AGS-58]|uniref:FG-GAP repeat protein n=1 Tax=unclassified Streptomyces TaxID=2593676 RepID=UPI0035A28FB5